MHGQVGLLPGAAATRAWVGDDQLAVDVELRSVVALQRKGVILRRGPVDPQEPCIPKLERQPPTSHCSATEHGVKDEATGCQRKPAKGLC